MAERTFAEFLRVTNNDCMSIPDFTRWQSIYEDPDHLLRLWKRLPTIPNLAQRVLKQITADSGSRFSMKTFHGLRSTTAFLTPEQLAKLHACGTSHCLAGWAVVEAAKTDRNIIKHEIREGTAEVAAILFFKSEGWIPPFYDIPDDAALEILATHVREAAKATQEDL